MIRKFRQLAYLTIGMTLTFSAIAAMPSPASAAASSLIAPTDSSIHYVGRWNTSNPSEFVSNWGGAYFDVGFTGPTLALQLGSAADLVIRIDGGANVTYPQATGSLTLTAPTGSQAVHLARVAARYYTDSIHLQGLGVRSGEQIVAPPASAGRIEFIGDSITAGYKDTNGATSDYAWLAGDALHMDHTQIAYTGICLTDNIPCYSPNNIGMSRAFLAEHTPEDAYSPSWSFPNPQPKAVVINLGTNDATVFNPVSSAQFQSNYLAFLQTVRTKYPTSPIIALRTFNGYFATETANAVQSFIRSGDTNTRFVDTSGWIGSGDFAAGDSIHPSDTGQQKLAAKVAAALAPIVRPSQASMSYLPTIENFKDVSDWTPGTDGNAELHSVGASAVAMCACGNGLNYGSVQRTVSSFDLDGNPNLTVEVPNVSPANGSVAAGQWGLKVSSIGGPDITLQTATSTTGEQTYSLSAITGWNGVKTFVIKLFVLNGSVEFKRLSTQATQLFSTPQPTWTTVNSSLSQDNTGVTVSGTASAPYGDAETTLRENVDTYPSISVRIDSLEAGAQWSLKVNNGHGDIALQYDSRSLGTFVFDVRQLTGWHGQQTFQLKLFVIGGEVARVHASSFTRPVFTFEPFANVAAWTGNRATIVGGQGSATVTAGSSSVGYGEVQRAMEIDLSRSSKIQWTVSSVSPGAKWALKVNDGSGDVVLQGDSNAVGNFQVDIPNATGWNGDKSFNLELYVVGAVGSSFTVGGLKVVG
ncbi:SGNH/GDSL hydrolase family protein [Frigoribacterium faeni]|uniref:SGNH/GDSL hydrolase family protein n=1 Tax=Frigoribacterium faeni TaxID=145483 RepID=UPI0024137D5E|nr:SGNH/GDSL hydrolase family protein [Frigoribacterium faeni]